MTVIFQCYGGTHTSVIAACLYIGRLSRTRPPRAEELNTLSYYDRSDKSEMGKIHYIGSDSRGNTVFALGSGKWRAEIREIMTIYLSFCAQSRQIALIDCLPCINCVTRAGGFISRRLGISSVGRPLINRGIQSSYRQLVSLVESFEKNPDAYIIN